MGGFGELGEGYWLTDGGWSLPAWSGLPGMEAPTMRLFAKTTFARQLRRAMTDAERTLWRQLRMQQMDVRFRRQHPLGPYIVDFVCLSHRLVVEEIGRAHV